MTTLRSIPNALHDAVERWRAAGSPGQPPSQWSQAVWQDQFREQADYLATLPQLIGRRDVIERSVGAPFDPGEATRAFITAMIWGYGTVGYGAFRTLRVLSDNDRAGERLAEVARIARDDGGPAAFEWLAQRSNRLRWLGVAFATKYLYFCTALGEAQPALVLDRLVRNWMAINVGWPLSLEWDVENYREYVETMCHWAHALSVKPDDLEMLVFQLAANADPQSLWSAPELFAAESTRALGSGEEISDATEIMELLDVAAVKFAALSSERGPDDLADFKQGIRTLKRIVLTQY